MSRHNPIGNDFHVDSMAQLQSWRDVYTHMCLFFEVDDASHPTIIDTLNQGLAKLTAGFPWVAGQTVNEGAEPGKSGTFKVKPYHDTPPLIVKDLRDDSSAPTMADLKAAKFPFRMLDEAVFAPRRAFVLTKREDYPTLLLQANFIQGGLVLTFSGSHIMMDAIGQDQVVCLFAKACRNEAFTSDELSAGNLDRKSLIPLLDDDYTPGPEIEHQLVKPKPAAAPVKPTDMCSGQWCYFHLSPSSLKAIKAIAMDTKSESTPYVSTDDAISTFIWQSVVRSRLSRYGPETTSTMGRSVDVRRYLGIPKNHPGLVQNLAYITYTAQELTELPLGAIASGLRAKVDPGTSDIAWRTRAAATYLTRTENTATFNFLATFKRPTTDVLMSSWGNVKCPTENFGPILGQPEVLRMLRWAPVENMFYTALETEKYGGGRLAGLYLRDDDLKRLKEDKEWEKYMTYIG
ncbi:Trichothecene 3-O-acetyltransferase [Cladobotryum mycophilum]|uniref:Trichothecene 3-O-acetyltransferase n=1 Tax=Cladobotryum mycophilum TaxID=491253 RepID=A0ABR0S4B8_9HYPO